MFHSMHHSSGSFWSKFIVAFFGFGIGLMSYAIGQDGVCCDPDAAWFDFPSCLGVGASIEDADGIICDEDCGPIDECLCADFGVDGCTDPAAQNFNADATCDDGSCVFVDCCNTELVWNQELSDYTVECSQDLPATCEDFAANIFAVNLCDGTMYEAACLPFENAPALSGDPCEDAISFNIAAFDSDCGRLISETFTVSRDDTTPPTITDGPADMTVECVNIPAMAGPDAISAFDNCGEDVTISEGTEDTIEWIDDCHYTLRREWTVTDLCGNTAAWQQMIVVVPSVLGNVEGCTDGAACNFDSNANQDDGSCEYCSCGALQGVHLRIDDVGEYVIDEVEMMTYRAHIVGLEPGDVVTSVFGYDEWPMHFDAPQGVYNSPFNPAWHPMLLTDMLVELAPDLGADTYGALGLDGAPGNAPTLVEDPAQPFSAFFTSDTATQFNINTTVGGGWYLPPDDPATFASLGGERLLMQWTTAGTFEGRINVQWLDASDGGAEVRNAFEFDAQGRWAPLDMEAEVICPCTDLEVDLELEFDSLTCIPVYSEESTYGDYEVDACADLDLALTWEDSIMLADEEGLPLEVLRTVTVEDVYGVVAQETQFLSFTPSLPEVWSSPLEIEGCPSEDLDIFPPPIGWNIASVGVDTLVWNCLQAELTRTWTLTDGCGNAWNDSQTIVAAQNPFDPVMGSLSDSSLYCGAVLPEEPLVDLVSTVTCTGQELSVLGYVYEEQNQGYFPSITFRYVAFSVECGILEEHFQTFSIIDTVAPSILLNLPEVVEVETFDDTLWPELEVQLLDDCDSVPTWTLSTDTLPGSCPALMEVHRHILAEDGFGNQATQTQIIAVIDTVAPEITLADDLTLECPAQAPAIEGEFAVADLSFVELVLTTDTVFGICAGNYDVVQSVAATDACNLTSVATRTVMVRDTHAPVLTTTEVELDCDDYASDVNYIAPDISDCSEITGYVWTDYALSSPSFGACKTIARTFEAYDQCGNLGTAIQLLQLSDTIPPSFLGSLAQLEATCGDEQAGVIVTDNCNSWVLQTTLVSSPPQLGLTQFRHHVATDACGNASTYVQYVTLLDGIGNACDPCNADASCDDCSGACGPNTFWDEVTGQCLPESLSSGCYFDTDGNGSVGTPDLLNFLSAFGNECE